MNFASAVSLLETTIEILSCPPKGTLQVNIEKVRSGRLEKPCVKIPTGNIDIARWNNMHAASLPDVMKIGQSDSLHCYNVY